MFISPCIQQRELLSHRVWAASSLLVVAKTVLQSTCTNLHSYLQHVRVSMATHLWQNEVLSDFSIFSNLMSVELYLTVFLNISLNFSEIKHLLRKVSAILLFFELCVIYFGHLSPGLSVFFQQIGKSSLLILTTHIFHHDSCRYLPPGYSFIFHFD